ncbi:MAG: c-type cytochrome [Planctomycetota bacterium]
MDDVDSFALLLDVIQESEDPDVQAALLKGILLGLEGRRNVAAPKGWLPLSRQLQSSGDPVVRERASSLSRLFGDAKAVRQAVEIVKDPKFDAVERRTALRSLLSQQNREASGLLPSLLDDTALKLDAIRGFAIVENKAASKVLLSRYPQLDTQQRRAVIETLASRRVYADALLEAIQLGIVSRTEVPTHVARSLADMLGERFTDVFGTVRAVAEDRVRLLAKYKEVCSPKAMETANASRGRVVFQKTCAACHTLYGEGGKVGPDLTGSNRANLDYILLNSVDPSDDVPDAYKTVSVLTVDGRVVNGVLAEEDTTRIVLKTAEQPRVVIAKDDIELRRVSAKSIMPEGQLDQLSEREVVDLIKYLRTTEQVEMVQ